MPLRRPRFTASRLVVVLVLSAVVAWLWACHAAGLDDEERLARVFMGIVLGLPILGVAAFFAVAMQACPGDPSPPESATIERPRLTIGCLMTTIAVAAVGLALILLSPGA